MKSENQFSTMVPEPATESPAGSYWEIGGHPNFLLSVHESVIAARERLAQVADTSLTVILYGERGVGKEVLARGIHGLSSREGRSFTALNAYAVPKAAIERELFGQGFDGKLAAAGEGTVYIHGVELIPPEVQQKLVDWKRDRIRASEVSPRFIMSCEQPSMTNEELEGLQRAWVAAGGAVRIEIPPLRDRAEDIPLLATHILQKYGPFYGSRIRVLRRSFVRFLQLYRWPGNTRELERVVRRFLVIEDEEAIRSELGSKQGPTEELEDELAELGTPLKTLVARAVARVERREITRALERARWNKKRAAADLGISYKSLLNKVKEYDIEA